MRRTEFIENIKDYVESNYEGEVIVEEINKSTIPYTGLYIRQGVGVPTPVVNLDLFYSKFSDNLDRCYREVNKVLNTKAPNNYMISKITDWKCAKDRLFLRIVRSQISDLCRKFADLWIVPYLQVDDDGEAVTKVTSALTEIWGVSSDEVFEQAQINQVTLRPVIVKSLASELGMPEADMPMYVVTSGCCGASAILYDGVVDMLREKVGGSFYILPSSIHEVIIVPKSGDVDSLIDMVTTMNNAVVAEDERLSNSVYTYDFDSCEFKLAG